MMAGTGAFSGLSRIGQIAMIVHDLPRAVAFYRDVLGMRFLFEAPPKMAFFDCTGIRLMLSLPETAEFDHPGSIIYYTVEDIQTAAAVLESRGVALDSPPHLGVGPAARQQVSVQIAHQLIQNAELQLCKSGITRCPTSRGSRHVRPGLG